MATFKRFFWAGARGALIGFVLICFGIYSDTPSYWVLLLWNLLLYELTIGRRA